MTDERDQVNFFRNRKLTVDPYPYFEQLRDTCPVVHEPHQGVFMVTGYTKPYVCTATTPPSRRATR